MRGPRYQARGRGDHLRHSERERERAVEAGRIGIVFVGATVAAATSLVGKVTPKGETQLTPEEKLLRAIFGEKASDVKDTSLRVPSGMNGTVIDVQVFTPRRDREGRAREGHRGLGAGEGPEGPPGSAPDRRAGHLPAARDAADREGLGGGPNGLEAAPGCARPTSKFCRTIGGSKSGCGAMPSTASSSSRTSSFPISATRWTIASRKAREADLGRRSGTGRAQDGQGLPGRQAAGPAGRQDGRPARQQGRHFDDRAGRGHAAHGGRHARSTSCSTPLGVPSRMNVGQVLETHLGWASHELGRRLGKLLDEQAEAPGDPRIPRPHLRGRWKARHPRPLSDEELVELAAIFAAEFRCRPRFSTERRKRRSRSC